MFPGMPDFDALGERAQEFATKVTEKLDEIALSSHATNYLLGVLIESSPNIAQETRTTVAGVLAAEREVVRPEPHADV
jgi:hypothetical protein